MATMHYTNPSTSEKEYVDLINDELDALVKAYNVFTKETGNPFIPVITKPHLPGSGGLKGRLPDDAQHWIQLLWPYPVSLRIWQYKSKPVAFYSNEFTMTIDTSCDAIDDKCSFTHWFTFTCGSVFGAPHEDFHKRLSFACHHAVSQLVDPVAGEFKKRVFGE